MVQGGYNPIAAILADFGGFVQIRSTASHLEVLVDSPTTPQDVSQHAYY